MRGDLLIENSCQIMFFILASYLFASLRIGGYFIFGSRFSLESRIISQLII